MTEAAAMTPRRRAIRAVLGLAIPAALLAALVLLAPNAAYDWLKALHVIAIIAWMAGLLYLPRLFVYHSVAAAGSEVSETLKTMERRLLEYIVNPAMVVSWAVGLWLAWEGFGLRGGWLHAKLFLVLVLSGLHGYFAGAVRAFAADRNTRSQRHWRIMNEMPTLAMIGIVILVIVKPF
jgi:putative membrane protein